LVVSFLPLAATVSVLWLLRQNHAVAAAHGTAAQ